MVFNTNRFSYSKGKQEWIFTEDPTKQHHTNVIAVECSSACISHNKCFDNFFGNCWQNFCRASSFLLISSFDIVRLSQVNIPWLSSEKCFSWILKSMSAKIGIPKYRIKFLNSKAFQLDPYFEYDLGVLLISIFSLISSNLSSTWLIL